MAYPIFNAMKRDLDTLLDWLPANRLALIAYKIELVLFRPKHRNYNIRLTLTVKERSFFSSSKVEYFGILLDPHLTWRPRISELAKTLSRVTGVLYKRRHYTDAYTLQSVYLRLSQTHLSIYGCLAWGFAKQTELDRLYKIQKREIRVITFSDFEERTFNLYLILNILKLNVKR